MDLDAPQLLESVHGVLGEGIFCILHFISLVHFTRFLYSVSLELYNAYKL
jgi:hypothetical protein